MENVIKTFQDHIAILRLDNGPLNSISSEMVDDVSRALVEIKGNARGMVLCGGDKFFSAGFHLPQLLQFDRSAMADFLERFNRLCADLFTAPYPTICALAGHAVAGGNIFALTCDYRYAASPEKKIGLNELKLGLPLPYLSDMLLRHTIGDRYATQMIYSGEFMSFADAKIIGMIDVIGSPDELEDFTLERLSQIAGHPPRAFAAAKANKVEPIMRRYRKYSKLKNDEFLDCWFSDDAQMHLLEASRKF